MVCTAYKTGFSRLQFFSKLMDGQLTSKNTLASVFCPFYGIVVILLASLAPETTLMNQLMCRFCIAAQHSSGKLNILFDFSEDSPTVNFEVYRFV